EDGIRDFHVTGVQTCALPISLTPAADLDRGELSRPHERARLRHRDVELFDDVGQQEETRCHGVDIATERALVSDIHRSCALFRKIGRASCREGVYISVV